LSAPERVTNSNRLSLTHILQLMDVGIDGLLVSDADVNTKIGLKHVLAVDAIRNVHAWSIRNSLGFALQSWQFCATFLVTPRPKQPWGGIYHDYLFASVSPCNHSC
jgi:hypothetical protein